MTFSTDFMGILDSFNLTQTVQEPTHAKGHTLDLVLHHGLNLDNLTTVDICVLDHKAVLFSIVLSLPHLNHILPVRHCVFNSRSASQFT